MNNIAEKFDEWNNQCRKTLNVSSIHKRYDELRTGLNPFFKRVKTISEKYSVSNEHAACFICNYNDDYICNKFNGGCEHIGLCERIHDETEKL